MKKFTRFLILGLIAVLALGALSGCAKTEDKKVVVSSKAHTEQYILGEMLALLIENHSDIKVERKLGLSAGGNLIHDALVKGDIDMYPEYTGTGWLTILKRDLQSDHDVLYAELKAAYENDYGLTWSDLYGFNNTYALTMRREQAEENNFTKASDLVGHTELVFGANPDYLEREDGYPGLNAAYGFDFSKIMELDIALKFTALENGQVDVINGFSTDAQLHQPQFVVVEDDKNYFTAYYAATVCRIDTLEKYPELEGILAKLDGQISEQEMIEMNYAVEVEGRDYEDVAKEFLINKGLI